MLHRLSLVPLSFAMACLAGSVSPALAQSPAMVDLTRAAIVVRPGPRAAGERAAADVLQAELGLRVGRRPDVTVAWPSDAPVVVAIAAGEPPAGSAPWGGDSLRRLPERSGAALRAEGFRLVVDSRPEQPVVWILGADGRGALFGVGELLRHLRWNPPASPTRAEADRARGVPATLDVTSAPAYAIRGHQLGYRQHSNTYDAWDQARYDRYLRELALLGVNSIENIPLQDTRVSPHFPLSREAMNVAISRLCERYDLDYWIWTPADFDLGDAAKRTETLDTLGRLFAQMPRLDAIFVPGGDPGHNAAQLVLPYLKDLAARVQAHHPRAKVWLSLQWFPPDQVDWIYAQINGADLPWFGGLVAGPSSPPLAETRARLHPRYRLRDYPDVTHTVRAQYVVPDWDPAFNFTLGREPINPRPAFYAQLHDRIAPFTDGFISYSDGVNDDVNKAIWSRKAWDPTQSPRAVLVEYARLFFGEAVAERAADGLLALERNWDGPLATNGAVDGTLALWQQLEAEAPSLAGHWRWQQALFRAYFDAYTRHRLLRETALQDRANAALLTARSSGAATAVAQARSILAEADAPGPHDVWRQRIEHLGAALFASIGMQMDTPRYKASGTERGAVLDFLHHPLNDRWWLEDECAAALTLPDEVARVARLETIARWETPAPGATYDDIGHVGRSPRVRRTGPSPTPHFTWELEGRSRRRLAWLVSLRWPSAIEYDVTDPDARHVLRLNGTGTIRPRINGAPVAARRDTTELGDVREYDVPADAVRSRRIVVTFDEVDERHLNWRQHSRLHEAWLIPARTAAPAR